MLRRGLTAVSLLIVCSKVCWFQNVMVLGDYNADCQYVRKSAWDSVTLFTNPAFKWFIPTGVDTASMNSECTFDRFVIMLHAYSSLRSCCHVAQCKVIRSFVLHTGCWNDRSSGWSFIFFQSCRQKWCFQELVRRRFLESIGLRRWKQDWSSAGNLSDSGMVVHSNYNRIIL